MNETISQVKSVCPYCGVGCGILMQVKDNQVINVSGDKSHPANRGKLCTKGLTCAQVLTAEGRLSQAYLREDRQQSPLPQPLDTGISEAARRLKDIITQHGPDALALYVSGQMSLEAQYLATKLAKGFIGTRHMESNSRLCMASASSGYKQSLGADGPPGAYDDFEQAELFLVIGANMADCHPILFLRMMARVNAGAKLIVVDTRRTATAEKASLFLQVKAGSDLVLLNGLLHLLIRHGKTDSDFIRQYTEGWEQLSPFLDAYPPERVAQDTGLSEQSIYQAAQWIGDAAEWMSCWTMGLNQSVQGTSNTSALCNLHLATGAICRPGSGPFSLTGQPNAMGGREMGYMGAGLPGQRSLLVEEDRRFTAEIWHLPEQSLNADSGDGAVSMFRQMAEGKIKACWIICSNPVASMADRRHVIRGLQQAELVITQDAFFETETNRYADIMLPGALWAEGEGVMINSERNVTLMQQAVSPPQDALPDWQIIAAIACEMGYQQDFTYRSAEQVFQELQQFNNPKTGYDLRGITYPRLRENSIQWPSAPEDTQSRHPIRYRDNQNAPALTTCLPELYFPTPTGKACFICCAESGDAELADEDYPFILNTGRLQHQWHTMTKTGRIPALNRLNPEPFLEVHPDDAAQLNITTGQQVELRSRQGTARLPARLSDRVLPGHCFAPFHWADLYAGHCAINALTNDKTDPVSLQPALKQCAVSLTPIINQHVASDDAVRVDTPASEPVNALALALGLQTSTSVTWRREEQQYLQGFLAGLQRNPVSEGSDLPILPASAPLTDEKRLWANGLLAGLFSRQPLTVATVSSPLTVLWCSTTGNAEVLARKTVQHLQQQGTDAQALSLADCSVAALAASAQVLLIVSTFGDGDPPDNGRLFWQALSHQDMPPLDKLCFSILALGDSQYERFCGFGRQLEARLTDLGAHTLAPRVECDGGDLSPVTHWLSTVSLALGHTAVDTDNLAVADSVVLPPPVEKYHRHQPLLATMRENRVLNGLGAGKETRQLVFTIEDKNFTYQPGDALGIWPQNSSARVNAVLSVVGCSPETIICLEPQGAMTLETALRCHLDLSIVSPELVALTTLGDSVNQPSGRVIDQLRKVTGTLTAQTLVTLLKPLRPRLYSIASSPLHTPNEVHLTVSVVRHPTEPLYHGTCSAFLGDSQPGDKVPIFVQRSASFRPPQDDSVPMIMIGPGTGIAPFRAFLQHRRARQASGKNWLIFGEQHAATDFYYAEELAELQQQGYLHRLDSAFSRDQPEKVYVQHRMLEQGETFWQWLQDGAYVCVCGDASRMAKDVHQTLLQIIERYGQMDSDHAAQWLTTLIQQQRYLRDIY